MANQVISMQQIRAIIQFLEKGFSLRAISTQLGICRPTITVYATRLKNTAIRFEALRQLGDAELSSIVYTPVVSIDYSEDERRTDFNNRVTYFVKELERPGVTRLLLWEEYRKEYVSPFGYTRFCELIKQALQTTKATMRLTHKPAEMMMVDFAGDKMSYVNKSTGELIACPVLVCVMPYSKYSFVMALSDATIPQVIKGLNQCLQYFGGVPLVLKTDNMKQVVTKSCRYEPVFSEVLQQWALHNNITLLATRVAKPKDKASVENEVKIAYQRIYAPLRDKVMYDIDELNATILERLKLHNEKLFQLKDHSRAQLFKQEEQPLLQPLSSSPFVIKHQVSAKVQKNYHITLGENYHHYSVPSGLIGKQVSVVYDTDNVEIYYQHTRIAIHRRAYKKHDYTTNTDHMPSGHRHYHEQQGHNAHYFLDQASIIGPSTHQYIDQVLKARAITEQTYNACKGILRLNKQYGSIRLEAACKRALFGTVFNYRTLQNILINRLEQLDQLETYYQNDLFKLPEHTNLRGPDAYQ
ncbi:MAG: IS21 family transposase [Sediminibacterium sp.]|uniref:IS21 family transposase n=1 Tax=Sediminibacterium sp. TaxID=1917865 RepID=UPI00271FDEA2|nr:IS21 family transposase [Sediminibacterium sp.]MDO8997320.1 IS21 family transposase [Sediminibacterium sp.]